MVAPGSVAMAAAAEPKTAKKGAGEEEKLAKGALAIAEYLGPGDAFDRSITDFSERYADQNEQDYQKFVTAIQSGQLAVLESA